MFKNIAFNISKHYFIYFNTLLYNPPTSKILFFYHFIKILFIYYFKFLFILHISFSLDSQKKKKTKLFLCVSLFSKLKQPTHPCHRQPLPTQCHHPQNENTKSEPTIKKTIYWFCYYILEEESTYWTNFRSKLIKHQNPIF